MNPVLRFSKRLSRAVLVVMLVLAMLWVMPALLVGNPTLPGNPFNVGAASDPVIAAAGDIACDPANSVFNGGLGNSNACRQKYTSDLLVNAGLAAVLDLGDNQYYCGGYQAFLQSYNLSWGRVKSITHPSVGNHEYLTSGGTGCDSTNAAAAGYFKYFGSAAGTAGQGWYSFNVGTWHIIALNSNCTDAGGCNSSSPQGQWLKADLIAHPAACTLAFWHIPLFSSGGRAAANSQSFWNTLYTYKATLILNGHDHIYERFAPQNASGALDQSLGIREFIVGTGGSDHTSIATIAANSELRNTATFGVLKLTLHATSYDWQFVPEAGKTFTDSGTGQCVGSAPSAPTPTPTATPTATNTPTPLPLATNTPTATATASPTSTHTPTLLPSATPSATPTRTPTPTATVVLTGNDPFWIYLPAIYYLP